MGKIRFFKDSSLCNMIFPDFYQGLDKTTVDLLAQLSLLSQVACWDPVKNSYKSREKKNAVKPDTSRQ